MDLASTATSLVILSNSFVTAVLDSVTGAFVSDWPQATKPRVKLMVNSKGADLFIAIINR